MQYHRGHHGGRADDPHGVTAPRAPQSMQWNQEPLFDSSIGKKSMSDPLPDPGYIVDGYKPRKGGPEYFVGYPPYASGNPGGSDWQTPEGDGWDGGSIAPAPRKPKSPKGSGSSYATATAGV